VRVWVHGASQALKVAHARAPPTVWLLRRRIASRIATLRACFRERDADEQTAGIAVQQIDASTVSEDYRPRDRQTKAHPVAVDVPRSVGSIEWFEDLALLGI